MKYATKFCWIRWMYCYPYGEKKKRGIQLRFWRFGFVCSWDKVGKFHRTRFPFQITCNRGPLHWTFFLVTDYDLYLEAI